MISWLDGSTPFDEEIGDVFFTSKDDALAAARYLFVDINEITARKNARVCELGFGTGLNILALAKYTERPIEVVSIDRRLLDKDVVGRALSRWPELVREKENFLEQYGSSKIVVSNISLEVKIGEVLEVLSRLDESFDVWILDGFDPKKNPEMWSEDVFREIRRLSNPGAVISTWCSSGAVRRGLEAAGFEVKKVRGFGGKRESLVARL